MVHSFIFPPPLCWVCLHAAAKIMKLIFLTSKQLRDICIQQSEFIWRVFCKVALACTIDCNLIVKFTTASQSDQSEPWKEVSSILLMHLTFLAHRLSLAHNVSAMITPRLSHEQSKIGNSAHVLSPWSSEWWLGILHTSEWWLGMVLALWSFFSKNFLRAVPT